VIAHVTVVDVAKRVPVPGQNVAVRGGCIVQVGDTLAVAIPARAEVVDGRGRFLIPGLWYVHVHAQFNGEGARVFLPAFVAHGVTGVRDRGGSWTGCVRRDGRFWPERWSDRASRAADSG